MDLLTSGGGEFDDAGSAGRASLTASLLDEGTLQKSSSQIAETVEALGGSLFSGAGWESMQLSVGLLKRHLPVALELLAEIVREYAFPQFEVTRLKRQRQVEIQRRRSQPAIVAEDRLMGSIHQNSPYSLPLVGTEESITTLDRDELVAYADSHIVPAGAHLIAVGPIAVDEFSGYAEQVFSGWEAQPLPDAPVWEAGTPNRKVIVVDRPKAAQTELRIGQSTLPRNHQDYLPLSLANTILGGKFSSRLNLNLREKHGFTYGAHSRLVARRNAGALVISAAVENRVAGAAIKESLAEIDRLSRQEADAEELRQTQDYLIGVFPYSLQSIDDIAARLQSLATFNLPPDYFDIYQEQIRTLTPQQVQRVFARHISRQAMTIVAVGPADVLVKQLESFGELEIAAGEAALNAD